jgi:fructokinase
MTVASPVDLNQASPTFGFITSTPKPGWANTNIVGPFRRFNVPVAFDTDVNAAAWNECKTGGCVSLSSSTYTS